MIRLWDARHPYHMNEGNYFDNSCHTDFEDVEGLLSEWADSDLDYNYVVRWDWLEGESHDQKEYGGDDSEIIGVFKVQVVGQRKSTLVSASCPVCRNDEPAIREFLEPRAAYAAEIWAPFLTPLTPALKG